MCSAPVVASVRPKTTGHQNQCGSEDVKQLDGGDETLAPNEGEETVEIQDENEGDAKDVEPLKLERTTELLTTRTGFGAASVLKGML